jgi:4-amino-4-deoxy-L-arabinose transferase-like glycosyltransferase
MTATQLPGPRPAAAVPVLRAPAAWHRALRGPAGNPRWQRPATLALLLATAILYLWDLSSSGYANSFYAAAVQAGSRSWKAWFFGSLDSSGFITVDKPPGALWVMGLSARIFGFGSWSLLVPQALEGVAAVALLAAAVRRVAGPAAGLIAGAALALTPAAVLIFRFDNPDAFLVLLLVAAAYCVTRALEHASTRWMVAAGAITGLAFLTKSGQALLPVPAFGLAYLVAAPGSLRRRIAQLLAAGLALVVAAGWWIAAVLLWPAADRPYIGGSTDNNPLQLAFGYNGLERLLGQGGISGGGGSGPGGASGSSFGGATGLQRLFSGEMGLEISWLLPAAILLLGCGIWLTWARPRSDRTRAAVIVWGGWLAVTAITFSYMRGVIHPYYTVALAPAVAAVTGIGAVLLWQRRRAAGPAAACLLLALVVAVTCGWDLTLLWSSSSFRLWAAAAAVVAIVAVLALAALALRSQSGRRLVAASAATAAVALALPAGAWAVATAATPHTGSIPAAVVTSGSAAGPGGSGAGPGRGTGLVPGGTRAGSSRGGPAGAARGSRGPGSAPGGSGRPGAAGAEGEGTGTPPLARTRGGGAGTGVAAGAASGGQVSVSAALRAALEKTTTRWAAATDGSDSAASLELATGGKAIMAIGGFTGSDPAPTLAQFKAYVAAGDISYYIAGGQGGGGAGGPGGSDVAGQIASWVEAHDKATTIGGQAVYLLTAGQAR